MEQLDTILELLRAQKEKIQTLHQVLKSSFENPRNAAT